LILQPRHPAKWEAFHKNADKLEAKGLKLNADIIRYAADKAFLEPEANFYYLNALRFMKYVPVTMEQFLEDEEFLGAGRFNLWPKLKEHAIAIKPHPLLTDRYYTEVLNGGSIASGKTSLSQACLAYDMYLLSCFDKPHGLYPSLSSFKPLVIIMQTLKEKLTKNILYEPLRRLFISMPFVKNHVYVDKSRDSIMMVNDSFMLVPALAQIQDQIGQDIIAGMVDEVNFMKVVEYSSQVLGTEGMGGRYDQAELVCTNLLRRRTSRFATKGPTIGSIYLSSSTAYRNDYLDRRIAQVENSPHAYIMKFKQYDVQPQEKFSGKTFPVLVGTEQYNGKILNETSVRGQSYPLDGHVENVPIEYLSDFEGNFEAAQRDVLGVASIALNRFIGDIDKIGEAKDRFAIAGHPIFLDRINVKLSHEDLPKIIIAKLPTDRHEPRFVHIDLARNSDRAAIAMTKISKFVTLPTDIGERVPEFVVEFAISIEPNQQAEIDLAKIRNWVQNLKELYGFNIKIVSYDRSDSRESIQLLRKSGITAMELSVDKSMEPYDTFKTALYQGRVHLFDNEILTDELAGLEVVTRGEHTKVDHRASTTKDIADAVAASIHSAANHRAILSEYNITNKAKRHSIARRSFSRKSRNDMI
jgi:hypothetical protein